MRRTLFLLFFVHLLTRLIFINITGVYNNYNHQCDSYWLVKFADDASQGDFNFDIGRFIASPLFPSVCGLIKQISPDYWAFYLILFQVLLSSLSGLFIYKIAFQLFNNKEISMLASILYAIFPMTMWYVHTFSQESLFQCLLIIAVYYLIVAIKTSHIRDTILSAVFFSLCYLTKSHILLFLVFIPLIYFHRMRWSLRTITHVTVFTVLIISFSIPYGIYQLKRNGVYVLSSNGAGYQFYLGNTEAGYRTIVDVPKKNTEEFRKLENITVFAGYFNGSMNKYSYILSQKQNLKQSAFYEEAINWIRNNPVKYIKLKLYDLFFFMLPGVSYRHYDFYSWLFSILISLPFYVLAYKSIYQNLRSKFSEHSWILYLIVSMILFSTLWYVQNRFRTITLEPFYIIYATVYLCQLLRKFSAGKSFIRFLDFMFLEFTQNIRIKKELKTFLGIR